MITRLENLPGDVIGFKFEDEVTAADYELVLFPAVEAAVKKNKNLKVLCQLENVIGFKLGALKDDMEIGFKYFRDWEKVAFVSNKEWINHTVRAFGFLIPGKVRTFKNEEVNAAIKWLAE